MFKVILFLLAWLCVSIVAAAIYVVVRLWLARRGWRL